MSDQEVVRLRWWDIDAFGNLYESHVAKIYRFLYYKSFDQALAEDLTQETFFKALKKIDTFRGETVAEFSSWLFTIAHHTSIDHFRASSYHDELDDSLEVAAVNSDFAKEVDERIKLSEVVQYLDTFSSEQKEILIMRIWDDLSYAEISAITGKTTDNCKKIVSRLLTNIQANIVYGVLFVFFLNYIFL